MRRERRGILLGTSDELADAARGRLGARAPGAPPEVDGEQDERGELGGEALVEATPISGPAWV